MKNIVFLFDIIVYSIQIISLVLTFFVFLKFRNKALRYYSIILSVTLLDNIVNSVKDFLNITIILEKIVLILINYFSSALLMIWFLYSAYMVHEVTGKKISRNRRIFILTVSLYPIFYVVSDVVFYGLLKFTPSTEFFSFCELSTLLLRIYYIFIFLYTSLILFQYRKDISDEKIKTAAETGMIFSLLFIPAFLVDLSSVLKEFHLYLALLLVWNLMNIVYLWKKVFSQDEVIASGIENTGDLNSASTGNNILKNDILTIRDDEGYIFIRFDDIVTARASNKRTVLKTKESSHSTDYTLKELEEKSGGKLIRVHRNTVINPGKIKKVEKYSAGTFAVIMENDEVVEMSRRISAQFRKTFLQ